MINVPLNKVVQMIDKVVFNAFSPTVETKREELPDKIIDGIVYKAQGGRTYNEITPVIEVSTIRTISIVKSNNGIILELEDAYGNTAGDDEFMFLDLDTALKKAVELAKEECSKDDKIVGIEKCRKEALEKAIKLGYKCSKAKKSKAKKSK